jgi:hypothetical protein
MHPTYDSIVEGASRVQKHIVLNEQVASAVSALEAGFVRIVDIAGSSPQLTDKGIVAARSRLEKKIIHESTYSR